jgi:hypothetical protein
MDSGQAFFAASLPSGPISGYSDALAMPVIFHVLGKVL